jgi:hypothetical protein
LPGILMLVAAYVPDVVNKWNNRKKVISPSGQA